jgi:hypothetical protein
MKRNQELRRLRLLQSEIDALRHNLGINSPGEVLYSSPICALEEEIVVVEADGMGGATTCVVEGNYPVDYITKYEKRFMSEEKAIRKAERLAGQSEFR